MFSYERRKYAYVLSTEDRVLCIFFLRLAARRHNHLGWCHQSRGVKKPARDAAGRAISHLSHGRREARCRYGFCSLGGRQRPEKSGGQNQSRPRAYAAADAGGDKSEQVIPRLSAGKARQAFGGASDGSAIPLSG